MREEERRLVDEDGERRKSGFGGKVGTVDGCIRGSDGGEESRPLDSVPLAALSLVLHCVAVVPWCCHATCSRQQVCAPSPCHEQRGSPAPSLNTTAPLRVRYSYPCIASR